MGRRLAIAALVLAAAPASATTALAAFPYTGDGAAPADLSGKETWMYAATPEPGNEPVNSQPHELHGVRGAHLVDADGSVPTAFRRSTGRPDVVIAVHDSGIKWDDRGAMRNLRRKTHLNTGELPTPLHDRTTALEPGIECATYAAADDANGDGVIDVLDFACDSRVERDGSARAIRGNGVDDLLEPQDVLIAFTDGHDDDANGFVDDVVGWDFLDDDNDPYDDVQYGHGTGEANDSVAEADNGQDGVGTCPNCTAMHIRVGDSFVADVNRFAQGVLYSVDNGALVIQEALGALNNSSLARAAVEYAHRHGATIIASAADEAAQHHHWPEMYPHVIVVNSVTKYDETFTPVPRSYLQFNGCTNFSSKIAIAIPSVSCSSDATGRAAGMAGLVHSAALDARDAGRIGSASAAGCELVDGSPCAISPDEVHQLMAAGIVGGEPQADDVAFTVAEVSCSPIPLPGCTDPALNALMGANALVVSPLVTTRRYPARKGHDQFYGYGRVNMERALRSLQAGRIPPAVEIQGPEWFDLVDPTRHRADVRAEIDVRGDVPYRCRVLVAPGSYAGEQDFEAVPSAWCDGTTARHGRFDDVVAQLDLDALRKRFPLTAGDFQGREPGLGVQTSGGRPNTEPYGFLVKVVATSGALTGQDRRNLYLHRDRDLLPGWPRALGGDVESSPALADLDGDNRNELLVAGSDGVVHALRRDGSELPGWPVKTDPLPLHLGGRAFVSGDVDEASGAVLASLAVGDLQRDGVPEVVAADLEGKVYAWAAGGDRVLTVEAERAYSGAPLSPFVPERRGKLNRTQHGFIGSPVLADLDGDGDQEIVAANMDRHVYAWHHDGSLVAGFPVLVVDPAKVAAIDPDSHRVSFRDGVGATEQQGAIINTPAVGDLDGDGRPEIVVGTNEEYAVGEDGGFHSAPLNNAAITLAMQSDLLSPANSRLYAIRPTGDPDGDLLSGPSPFLPGWPAKVAKVFSELLPIVGEGITGAPVIGDVACLHGGRGPKIGVIPDGGPAMLLNPDTSSCLGELDGKPIGMQSDIPSGNPARADIVTLPAVGHPSFGNVGGLGTSFLAPTTGLLRALDLAVNEYQGGEDSYSAWNPTTGQFLPGFPQRVNDLSFLTGMSVADVGGLPGEEAVGGTAHLDLQAFGLGGLPPSPDWPKLTGDWIVANPLLGSFGQDESSSGARRVVVAATRAGNVLAYETDAHPCSGASWPRFHHDNANSGDTRRDATPPGRPAGLRIALGIATFTAPGDDLLCGRVAGYEVKVGVSWRRAFVVAVGPGLPQAMILPAGATRLRAVDDAGNVGRSVAL